MKTTGVRIAARKLAPGGAINAKAPGLESRIDFQAPTPHHRLSGVCSNSRSNLCKFTLSNLFDAAEDYPHKSKENSLQSTRPKQLGQRQKLENDGAVH